MTENKKETAQNNEQFKLNIKVGENFNLKEFECTVIEMMKQLPLRFGR